MIYYVSGPVTVLEPGLAVIDCGGVGYGCRVTAYPAGQLKLNQNARLYVTESIREDAFDLYGFISREEQREEYVPRPAWQVWAARVGLELFILFVIYQVMVIARGGML